MVSSMTVQLKMEMLDLQNAKKSQVFAETIVYDNREIQNRKRIQKINKQINA